MKSLSLLMLTRKTYPCSHAMLETVYTQILPRRGHRVTWVMPSGDRHPISRWELARWNDSAVYVIEGDGRDGSSANLRHRFTTQNRAAQEILRREHIDLVQVRVDWVGGLAALALKRRWKIPFVYQVSFPRPEATMLKGGSRRYLGLLEKRMERFLIDRADLVLPISEWMMTQFVNQGVPAQKMVSFPLGADTTFCPEDYNGGKLRHQLGLDAQPTVIYFGAMDRVRHLEFLLRVIAKVAQRVPDVKLLMVGDSEGAADLDWLKQKAREEGVNERTIFTGRVPRSQVPEYIAAANVSVSPIVPLPIYVISSPTKAVESMGMATPVVGNDIPEQKFLLTESRGGICTDYDETSFANAMVWLLQHPSEAKAMGQAGRRYIEKHRSYEVLATRVEDAYEKLV